jgi:hypothetical protein
MDRYILLPCSFLAFKGTISVRGECAPLPPAASELRWGFALHHPQQSVINVIFTVPTVALSFVRLLRTLASRATRTFSQLPVPGVCPAWSTHRYLPDTLEFPQILLPTMVLSDQAGDAQHLSPTPVAAKADRFQASFTECVQVSVKVRPN